MIPSEVTAALKAVTSAFGGPGEDGSAARSPGADRPVAAGSAGESLPAAGQPSAIEPGAGDAAVAAGQRAGLVHVPPVPSADPASAVSADPWVPENQRVCGNCGELVGQPRDGRPGMTEGFCRNCGTRFSFHAEAGAG